MYHVHSEVYTVSLPVPHVMSPHYRAGHLTSGYLARLDLGKAPISAKSGAEMTAIGWDGTSWLVSDWLALNLALPPRVWRQG